MSDQTTDLTCANCGQLLDAADKFCRECGLPTLRSAASRKFVSAPPDTAELKRALNVVPDPQPFVRDEPDEPAPALPPAPPDTKPAPDTTGSILHATSPTLATQMATSTLLMIAVIVVLAIAGIVLLILAYQG